MAYLLSIRRMTWGFGLTHAGLMLMLAAGAVTFYYGSESHLILEEGDGANVSFSGHEWEVAAWEAGPGSESARTVSAFDTATLHPGDVIPLDQLGLAVEVETYYVNCLAHRDGPAGTSPEHRNASGITRLDEQKASRSPSQDRPGTILSVRRGDETARLLLFGEEVEDTTCVLGDATYAFALRRKRFPLPAVISLLDFQKKLHPGSQMAKSYSSRVTVEGDGMERQVLISMNKPLRYKGFTFYQSSYQELGNGREASTLSVVKNYGRLLPYVATGVVSLGMILHFLGRLVSSVGRRTRAAGGAR
jgi:hypothetical protein